MAEEKTKKAQGGDKPQAKKPAGDKPAKGQKGDKAEKVVKDVGGEEKGPTPRLQEMYKDIRKALQKELGLENANEVPRVKKIVINIGQGEGAANSKILEGAVKDLEAITGQKAVLTKARKSIAGFKLRQGMVIGCCVTLRKARMYEFLDRFINVAVPRIRDFRGFSPKAFDGRGNYSVGVREQIIFPEIDYDKVDRVRSMGVTICMSARTDVQARALLDKFNFPFRK
jgi:large subunit ribosomal protein L5